MIGLPALAARLSSLGNDELLLWLEAGLRTLGPRDDAEGVELAFQPLLLSRGQPPMQQFHTAVEAMPGAIQARLRWACGRLLDSLRAQDEQAYVRRIWSLAVAFKPPAGLLPAARHFLANLPDEPGEIEPRRPIVNAIVAAVLSYPRSEEQDNFIAELRRHPVWTAKYTEQYVLYLVRDNPTAWVDTIRCFNTESPPLSDAGSGFFRRLAKAVGQANLALGTPALNRGARLDWLFWKVQPYNNLQFRDNDIAAGSEGTITVILQDRHFPDALSDDEAEAFLMALERPRSGDAARAHARIGKKLHDPRLDQFLQARAN